MILVADIPGERLDAFLARSAEGLSRSAAQKLIEEGNVLRNGKPGKKNDKLNMGDEISLTIPEPKEVDIVAKEIPLDIVYEDEDLMEDLLIEMRQAIEMCSIYTGVLASTQDAVASIISNNLNIVMKVMTAASIILTIPTMVFSFYGMNTPLPMPNAWFPLLLAALLTSVTIIILIKRGMFR